MSKKVKNFIFPGTALLTSFYLSIAFAIGAIIAYFAADLFVKKFIKTGKAKSLVFNFKKWQVHLHHWLIAGLIIITVSISDSLSLPFFWSGVLGGLIFHDIYTDKKWRENGRKWYHIVYKNPSR